MPSTSSSSTTLGSSSRGTGVAAKRRNPKVVFSAPRRNPNADEIAFQLGMSISAFVSQVLERNGELGSGMSSEHLAKDLENVLLGSFSSKIWRISYWVFLKLSASANMHYPVSRDGISTLGYWRDLIDKLKQWRDYRTNKLNGKFKGKMATLKMKLIWSE